MCIRDRLKTLYADPAHSSYYKLNNKENTLDELSDFIGNCLEDQDLEVVALGDTNGRISSWKPSFTQPNEDPDDREKEKEIVFDRTSKDEIINNFGKKIIEICTCFNLVPLLGLTDRQFPDDFTYVSERGTSTVDHVLCTICLLYTSPSPRDLSTSRMPSSA